MDTLEPPCKVEDILTFSFQFENLQKYLLFLSQSNSTMMKKIADFTIKLAEMDEIKAKFEDIEFKMDSSIKKFIDIEQSLNAHQAKIMESENKLWLLNNKSEENESKIKQITDKSVSMDENINNLNRLTEENIKNFYKMNETLEKVRSLQDNLYDRTEGVEKKVTKITDEMNEKERKNKEQQDKIDSSLDKNLNIAKDIIKENVEKINKKISETEGTIIKVVESVSELSAKNNSSNRRTSNVSGSGQVAIQNLQNEATNNLIMSELNKNVKDIDELKKDKKTITDQIEDLIRKQEELEGKIKNVNNKIETVKEVTDERLNSSMLISNNDLATERDQNKEQLKTLQNVINNNESMSENITKLNDNLRIVSHNLGHKATKDDLEKINKNLKVEIDKLADKFNESSKLLELKIKTLATSRGSIHGGSGGGVDLYDSNFTMNIQESVEKLSKQIIEREMSNIDFSKNEQFKDAQFKIDYNKSEIDKVFESIIEIRKTFVETSSPLEENVKEANGRILDIELNMRRVKMQLDDVIKNLEGESHGEEENKNNTNKEKEQTSNSTGSLREYIRNLAATQKILTDKIDKIGQKQDNMNAEILAKVKKDLQFESNRILEDFKQDLKTSINKIEDQLREKVDRFNLDEFGKRIDSKFNYEINKKLDRNDLKKNNNLINRKIDTLENKISKTLVDTLIDLQMEEAPLITKKTMAGEKCASCNQFLPHHHGDGHHEHKNLYKTTAKFNTSTYRPGEVKLNSPINEVSEDEKNSKKLQLPDINTNKSNPELSTSMVKKKGYNKQFNPSQTHTAKYEEFADSKNFNSMINEELEKKYLGPNDLIKTANKAYDNKK